MNKKLVIIGAGGHGRVVADCAEQMACYEQIIFLDDCYPERQLNAHWAIVGKSADWQIYLKDHDFICAYGPNVLRLECHAKLKAAGANLVVLIHPSALISAHTKIGLGTVVFAGVVINIGSNIGEACIINTAASIDHDANIADGAHISPQACLAGQVTVGKRAWLGINATVIQCIKVAEDCQIGAGAVVIADTIPNALYVGVPAKLIKSEVRNISC